MANTAIEISNISKKYRLGVTGSGSLRQDMHIWWSKNVSTKLSSKSKTNAEFDEALPNGEFWALKNVSFKINEGESVGIIGKNGAGKSTLLKILSRIIKPTTGSIRGVGKVSSLLEVGTGFHQELSGRENIFISGHILGMNRREIKAKFDEIVDFSGIEKFIDTPVKRYSSGMYVRLAFAVAANLEPDILIVDEVLAVGDADFQKKCLQKMKDASSTTGRTVIFVSHNLQAVHNLCQRAIWLDKGEIKAEGKVGNVINSYIGANQGKVWKRSFESLEDAPGNENIRIKSVELFPNINNPESLIDIRTPITVKFSFSNLKNNVKLSVDLLLFTLAGECIFDIPSAPVIVNVASLEGECTIPGNFLNDGSYYFSLYFVQDTSKELFNYSECLFFDVADYRENVNWYDKWWGYVRPNFPIDLKEI